MIGYCWRTSAAASRPSLTSCSGVYLFFGILITVCATRPLTARHTNIKRAATRADEVLVAMFPLLHGRAAIRVSGDRSSHACPPSARHDMPWLARPGPPALLRILSKSWRLLRLALDEHELYRTEGSRAPTI